MRNFLIYLIAFVVMLVIIILQYNFFSYFTLVGTTANLGLVLIAAVGLITGKERGAIFGVIYGFILDVLESRALGVYMLTYMLLGYFTGEFGKNLSKDNKATLVAVVGVCSVIFEIIVLMINVFFNKEQIAFIKFSTELLKEGLYNMLIVIVFYPFLSWFSDLINRTKNNYYML